MADFIISPYALSYNSIKEALQSYIQNKSELQNTWKDFYVSGAGETILELDAAVAAFYAFHFILGRKEAYLPTAQNYTSIVGGAQALGYSASRGHNLYLQANIIPNTTQTLSKWTTIGGYGNYDVVLLEDTILNAGQETTIKFVIGDSVAQSIQITTDSLQQFTFTAPDVTDDFRLLINTTVVPHTTDIKQAVDDLYVAITNTYGAVDVFYLNNGAYNYHADDTLYLQYIQRNNLTYSQFSPNNLDISISTEVSDIQLLEDFEDVEDKEHIRLAAPITHETNDVVRARKDYVKYLIKHNKFIIDANDKDINPGLIALTYLKEPDSTGISPLLSEQEKRDYISSIMQICPDGVAKSFIEDPILVLRTLQITLTQKADENIGVTIQDDINNILKSYTRKLQPTLDLQQIEHDIERLTGVKTTRVTFGSTPYSTNTNYKLYDIVTVSDTYSGEEMTFYCSNVRAKTGVTEPDWSSAPNYGDVVFDNNLVWEKSDAYANSISAKWKENGEYTLYSDVLVGYTIAPDSTTDTEPTWGGNIVEDGNVSCMLVETYNTVIADRQPDTAYMVNDYAFFKNNNKMGIYSVVATSYKSGQTEPDWSIAQNEGDYVMDNALTWELKYKEWKAQESLGIGDIRVALLDGKLYVYMASMEGTTGDECKFDGSEEVQETTTQQNEEDMPEEVVIMTWTLQETIEDVVTWTANTQLETECFVKGGTAFFECIENNDRRTSTEEVACIGEDGNWLDTIVDNNITWELQQYINQYENRDCVGETWKPSSVYMVGDVMIENDSQNTYVYEVYYTNPTAVTENQLIYSVVNYAGTTGQYEPYWGQDNVIDNNILWTKTNTASDNTWAANTDLRLGHTITTDEGYYMFTSIVGTSGNTAPNWLSLNNNEVVDNNITWKRLINDMSIPLQWNQYINLNFTLNIVR